MIKLDAYAIVSNNNRLALVRFACQSGLLAILNKLIALGGDIHVKRNTGWTLAQLSCKHGHTDVLKRLVELDVNVDARLAVAGFGHISPVGSAILKC